VTLTYSYRSIGQPAVLRTDYGFNLRSRSVLLVRPFSSTAAIPLPSRRACWPGDKLCTDKPTPPIDLRRSAVPPAV
jgi:hypothetical protein